MLDNSLLQYRAGTWLRTAGFIILLCCSLLVSGCWDQRELQERNFVLASAIDKADVGGTPGAEQLESFSMPHGDRRYRFSLQILRLGSATGNAEARSKGRTFVVSNTGQSLFEMTRDMLGQLSKPVYFEHIQAVIISEAAVMENGLAPLIDYYLRDAELRWRTRVFITPGAARPLLEYKPPSGEPGGIFINKIVSNIKNTHVGMKDINLGHTAIMLDNDADVMLPRIELVDNVVKVGGLALFKRDKFVGYADEYAVKGMEFIAGTEKSAVITINDPDNPGNVLVFELFIHDTKLTPHIEGNNIYFTLDIAMWGNIDEMQTSKKRDTTDPQYIRKLEVLFAEEVRHNVAYAMQQLQTMRVDPLRFGRKIAISEPKKWEQIKAQWDEIYPTVPLETSVNITIRNVGEHQ